MDADMSKEYNIQPERALNDIWHKYSNIINEDNIGF